MLSYGPPTDIYRPSGGLLFHYKRGEDQPSRYFRLQDGIVVEFWVEDPSEEDVAGG